MTNIYLKSVFRWEDAASLEHACWACPTKANSPRALQTCYGIHSMPCASYHPTMHAIGAAHRCSGCAVARAMHDARHREIAGLVCEYHSVNAAASNTETLKKFQTNVLGERSINIPFRPRQSANSSKSKPLPLQYGHNTAIHDSGIEMDLPSGIENDNGNTSSVDFEDDTLSTVSSVPSTPVTPLTSVTATSRKPSAAEKRATKKARKSAHSQCKAIKNQCKNIVAVTSADVERVAVILHGEDDCLGEDDGGRRIESHPLAEDRGIEDVIARNLKFVKAIQAHKAYLRGVVADGRKERKERRAPAKRFERGDGEEADGDDLVDVILFKLGVRGVGGAGGGENPVCAKARKASGSSSAAGIAARLRVLVREDLEKHENEVQQMYVRAGGFWRYVGRTVFERMTVVAEGMDVRSGEKNLAKLRKGSVAEAEGEEE